MNEPRNLTDADVAALADALEERFVERFERAAGKGLIDLLKRGFWISVLALAAYGLGAGKLPIAAIASATGKG
jgi:hypothetical protein